MRFSPFRLSLAAALLALGAAGAQAQTQRVVPDSKELQDRAQKLASQLADSLSG